MLLMIVLASFVAVDGCDGGDSRASSEAAGSGANRDSVGGEAAASAINKQPVEPFRNVILLIGDGMGFEHLKLARAVKGKPLVFDDWPVQGSLATTPYIEAAITDSAAAATAIATGVRTRPGRLSVDHNGIKLPTILERFQKKGARVGLVATKSLTDATPAAFVAHHISRRQSDNIARQMIASRCDLMLGSGWGDIGPALGAGGDAGESRTAAARAEYHLVRSIDELKAFDPDSGKRLLGVFGQYNMQYMVQRRGDTSEPTLAEMTRVALATLGRDEQPFFVMIEGSKIDTAGHSNSPWELAGEMLAFDEAAKVVCDWLDENEGWGDTLVMVLADHETGGLTFKPDANGGLSRKDLQRQSRWSTGDHTAARVPLFAKGAGSRAAAAARHLTDVHAVMSRSSIFMDERHGESVPPRVEPPVEREREELKPAA